MKIKAATTHPATTFFVMAALHYRPGAQTAMLGRFGAGRGNVTIGYHSPSHKTSGILHGLSGTNGGDRFAACEHVTRRLMQL